MSRIFITGSADGLGQLAAKALIDKGHQVVLHARNTARGQQALTHVPGAENVLIADLSSIDETKALASKANDSGPFDAVIHNAGIYQLSKNNLTSNNIPILFAVNSLAPYILTCLMHKPKRLVYLSSGMHLQGNPKLDNLPIAADKKNNRVSYSDTKLHNLILSMTVARRWTNVSANAVDPGWVPTKMGGAGAPDSLEEGYQTQVWLAASNDREAMVSGHYFHHKRQADYLPTAKDISIQEKFLALCEQLTGVRFNDDN